MTNFLLFVAALYSLNPVTISVYPAVSMAPATMRITVLVPRHVDNREICYAARGPEVKSSCIHLDGWQSQRVWTVFWNLRTGGEYTAEAVLTRIEEGKTKTYRNSQMFRVIGMEP